ncbi:MAG: hypothetical protein EA390_14450 [Balneolaceae bacterium]|nr:MAG: hypothetical protein EA390_14450 [Balneolaceae bacterium]
MKAFTLFMAFFILTTAGSAFAQFRNLNSDQIDDKEKTTVLRLTPEMFSDQISIPDFTPDTQEPFQFLETKISHNLIYLGASILWNKLDLDPGSSSFSAYPRTVTEYNNAVRRQIFDAEPTSQQRRSAIFFRNN